MNAAQLSAYLLLLCVIPTWILAGLADYFCHRASHIETTAGPYESALHLIGFGIIGLPILLGLFFEINGLLLGLMVFCLIAHHAIVAVDLSYACSTRRVTPLEQMIHSFLEIVPLTAFLLVLVIHSKEITAIAVSGKILPDPPLDLRNPGLPTTYTVSLLGAVLLLNLIPFLEELFRGIAARRAPVREP